MLPAPDIRDAEHKPVAPAVPVSDVDTGQPVDDLPPLVEPTDFVDARKPAATSRPPRRSFLAPVVPSSPAAPPPERRPIEIPPLVEPIAEPSPYAISARWSALPRRWWTDAKAALPTGRKRRVTLVAIAATAAIVLTAGLADIIGVGPFSRARDYRASASPPSSPALRFAFYQRGAEAGDANAELQLAILYAKGEGVPQNYATAATWFRAAANQGMARAQYDLGVLYERGRGVPADQTEAATWYLKAAEGKYPLAQYNLAVCYTKGQGTRKDLPEAALWYRRAAGQGVVQAMINLAAMYEKGDGVAASTVDAYAWYLAAGRRDNQAAARRAEDLFAILPQLDQIRAQALASDVNASIRDPQPQSGEPQ
jgi:hypothetical protein